MAGSHGRGNDHDDEQRKAFAAAYRRHSRELYRYCLRHSGNHAIAEEALGTVFLEAWRRRSEVDLVSRPIKPWLYGVAENVTRNQWRAERRQEAVANNLTHVHRRHAEDPSEELARQQDTQALVGALVALPEGQREVVVLCVFGDRTYEAAAAALEVSVGTVRSRLHRARLSLSLSARAAGGS